MLSGTLQSKGPLKRMYLNGPSNDGGSISIFLQLIWHNRQQLLYFKESFTMWSSITVVIFKAANDLYILRLDILLLIRDHSQIT